MNRIETIKNQIKTVRDYMSHTAADQERAIGDVLFMLSMLCEELEASKQPRPVGSFDGLIMQEKQNRINELEDYRRKTSRGFAELNKLVPGEVPAGQVLTEWAAEEIRQLRQTNRTQRDMLNRYGKRLQAIHEAISK